MEEKDMAVKKKETKETKVNTDLWKFVSKK